MLSLHFKCDSVENLHMHMSDVEEKSVYQNWLKSIITGRFSSIEIAIALS